MLQNINTTKLPYLVMILFSVNHLIVNVFNHAFSYCHKILNYVSQCQKKYFSIIIKALLDPEDALMS